MPLLINKIIRFVGNSILLITLLTAPGALSGCIHDVMHSGKNADYAPEDMNGYPDTLEKRGMAVPVVVKITPVDKYFGPECKITVIFNEKMERTSVEEKFRIYNSDDYPFHGKFIWGTILNTDMEFFDFIPIKQLPTGQYKVILFEGAKSAANIEMKERFISSFNFKPLPYENKQ
mgnify:CR=1 FL=1